MMHGVEMFVHDEMREMNVKMKGNKKKREREVAFLLLFSSTFLEAL